MKVYDKVSWHIDAGESTSDVIEKFSLIFDFLNSKNMLNENGEEIYSLGINTETPLHSELVNEKGVQFLDKYYDRICKLSNNKLIKCFGDL